MTPIVANRYVTSALLEQYEAHGLDALLRDETECRCLACSNVRAALGGRPNPDFVVPTGDQS